MKWLSTMIRDEDHVNTKKSLDYDPVSRTVVACKGWPGCLPVRDSKLAAGTLDSMEPLPD
jgi:hypothetical protein